MPGKNKRGMEKVRRETVLTVSHTLKISRDAMELWGTELETNKRYIFIPIIKVTVTCCWGQRCKFEEGLNKSQNQCRLVVPWWFLLCISSLAQQLHNQFLHETARIYHGTRSGINHAPFLHTFLKDPLLVSGLSGPFIRQIRAVSLTRIGYNKTTVNTSCQEHKKSWDTKNPRTPLFLLLCCFRDIISWWNSSKWPSRRIYTGISHFGL